MSDHDKAVQAGIDMMFNTHETGRNKMAAIAAAIYEADADNITNTGTYAPMIVEAWLRQRAKELRGEL